MADQPLPDKTGTVTGPASQTPDVLADLFVCHAFEDGAAQARRLVTDFESRGVRCWIAPRDIQPGKSWPSAIVAGIEGSRAVLLVLTDRANSSEEVEKEVTLAAHLHKVIFPVRVANFPLSGTLLYQIQSRQWRDLFSDREAVVCEIADQIEYLRGAHAVANLQPPRRPSANASTSVLSRRTAIVGAVTATVAGLGYEFAPELFKHIAISPPLTREVAGGGAPVNMEAQPSAPAITTGHERRVALTIGNSNYLNVPSLMNPAHDSDILASTLMKIGFEASWFSNLGGLAMRDVLARFKATTKDSDWAVFFYSGHGIQSNGQNYLIPIDARLDSEKSISYEALSLSEALGALEGARKIKVSILDACRNNPFVTAMNSRPGSRGLLVPRRAGAVEPEASLTPVGLARISSGHADIAPPPSSVIAYSAAADDVALDSDGMNSPFVSSLIRHIVQPGLEINKVFRLVADDVFASTGGRQKPAVYSTLSAEDFCFAQPHQSAPR